MSKSSRESPNMEPDAERPQTLSRLIAATRIAASTRDMDDTAREEGLWDANDLARFLKVSRSWVYGTAQRGALPSLKIGGLLRFEPAAIRAFIKGKQSSK